MGYFSRLATDIEETLFEGATVKQIAEKFNISEAEVLNIIKMLESADRDSYPMDNSDFDGMN